MSSIRKQDRKWMLQQIDEAFEFGLTECLSHLYADGQSIPGAIVNAMADKVATLVRRHVPSIKDSILERPETENMLVQWNRIRQGRG